MAKKKEPIICNICKKEIKVKFLCSKCESIVCDKCSEMSFINEKFKVVYTCLKCLDKK
jgi:hypothetical protein